MKFTPLNIKNQEFNKAYRGYDKEEVKAFLSNLADEFEKLYNERENNLMEIRELRKKIVEYQKLEKGLQNTLLMAQETANQRLGTASEKAKKILEESKQKADNLLSEARKEVSILREAAIKLKEEKKLLISELKAMVETQEKLLKNFFSHNKNLSFTEIDDELNDILDG